MNNRHKKEMDEIQKEKKTRRSRDQETLSPRGFGDLLGSPLDTHRPGDGAQARLQDSEKGGTSLHQSGGLGTTQMEISVA